MNGESGDEVGRRVLLKSGAAAVSAGVLGGLAGCSSLGVDGVTGGSTPETSAFLYAPGAVADVERYGVSYVDGAALTEMETDLPEAVYERFENRHADLQGATDVHFGQVEWALSFQTTTVLAAEYDQTDAAEELDRVGFDDRPAVGDYEPWATDDGAECVALGPGTIVGTTTESEDGDAENVFETVAAAVSGDEPRYPGEDDAVSSLLDALSGAHAFEATPHRKRQGTDAESGQFDGEVARGVGVTLDPEADEAAVEFVLVFESADAVDTDAVSTWVDGDAFADYADVNVTAEGTVARVSSTVALADVSLEIPEGVGDRYSYVPAPTAVTDSKHLNVDVTNPRRIAGADGLSPGLESSLRRAGRSLTDLFGVESEDLTLVSEFGPASVMAGDFEKETLTATLEDEDFEKATTLGDYEVYEARNGFTVAVSAVDVVSAFDSDTKTATEVIQTVADAKTGDQQRYLEANADFALAVEKLDGGDWTSVSTQETTTREDVRDGEFRGVVATGAAITFDGEMTHYRVVDVYAEQSQADTEKVGTYVEEERENGFFSRFDELDWRAEGRTTIIEGTIPTTDL
jgi:hypothetical protein